MANKYGVVDSRGTITIYRSEFTFNGLVTFSRVFNFFFMFTFILG